MGSLPEGTLCAYCGAKPAGYIPDGAVGPMCMGSPEACFERMENGSVEAVCRLRLVRQARATTARLAKPRATEMRTSHFETIFDVAAAKIAEYLWQLR